MTDEHQGGRIFFSSTGRTLDADDEVCLLSVGVDIGSSTSRRSTSARGSFASKATAGSCGLRRPDSAMAPSLVSI